MKKRKKPKKHKKSVGRRPNTVAKNTHLAKGSAAEAVPVAKNTTTMNAIQKACQSTFVQAAVQGASKLPHIERVANKMLLPAAIAIDSVRLGMSIQQDIDQENKIPKNTVKSASSIAGGWSAGYGGAVGGATAGTAIFPGVGTVIGGVVGGVVGAVGGSLAGEKIAEKVMDQIDQGGKPNEEEQFTAKTVSGIGQDSDSYSSEEEITE
ncbi:unnamed protein product [Haemonchus placei]|uniref:Gly-zipper_Omp domain-containing protein n=1 Tax=Haemonchus placei TaxID=6290 RepID=A0A0N4VUA3_HAEPC|nr:unnamed protein product [Haemonchus placei]